MGLNSTYVADLIFTPRGPSYCFYYYYYYVYYYYYYDYYYHYYYYDDDHYYYYYYFYYYDYDYDYDNYYYCYDHRSCKRNERERGRQRVRKGARVRREGVRGKKRGTEGARGRESRVHKRSDKERHTGIESCSRPNHAAVAMVILQRRRAGGSCRADATATACTPPGTTPRHLRLCSGSRVA